MYNKSQNKFLFKFSSENVFHKNVKLLKIAMAAKYYDRNS